MNIDIIFASRDLNRFLSLIAEIPNSQGCSGLSFLHLVQLVITMIIPNENTKI